jgi:uncharacterized Zn finger protein (UPF0148 family)
MNQTDTMADVRSFFTPKPKTETADICKRCGDEHYVTPTETYCPNCKLHSRSLAQATEHKRRMDLYDAMVESAKSKPKPKPETTQPELEEAYRQGFKDAKEEDAPMMEEAWKGGRIEAKDELWVGWEFQPTLQDIANGGPTMSKEVDGELIYRYPTKEELDKVIWREPNFRFPIGYDGGDVKYVTYRSALTWTLREFVERAQMIYSSARGKHLKAMGDHIFFEGFVGDTFHCGS